MTCDMSSDRLWAWVHDEADNEAAAAQIAAHVASCEACGEQVAEMRGILGDLNAAPDHAPAATESSLPERIGPYRVIRRIGRGGMGVVYEAEQSNPRRSVALKVILGWRHVDELQIRMFQREVQTLARLNHPAIAAVYDAGVTDDGQNYFAMEYVPGVDLIDHVNGRDGEGNDPLATHDRLNLFLRICDAVSYAHGRGVIHRDLKPSNILVANEGIEGRRTAFTERGSDVPHSALRTPHSAFPKILDFGLARFIDGDEAGATIQTDTGRVIGTLPYMSPEQARGEVDRIDVRSDVYALGVIFYEMMTGSRPYEVSSSSLVRAVQTICERAPTDPRIADRALPADLGTIMLKALEKEPERRYQSTSELVEDIRRFLDDRPILARPPSAIYHARKLVARHKSISGLVAALVLSLIGTGVVFVVQARRTAEQAEHKLGMVNAFVSTLGAAQVWNAGRGDITVGEALSASLAEMEAELADQPLIAATIRNTVGNTYRNLGDEKAADRHLSFALRTRRKHLGDDHIETAESQNDLGVLRYDQGDIDDAERLWRAALATRRRELPDDDEGIAVILNNLGNLLRRRGDFDAAEMMLVEALSIRRRIYERNPDATPDSPRPMRAAANNCAQTLNNLAGLLRRRKTPDALARAGDRYAEALEIREKALGPDHPEVAKMLNNQAKLFEDMRQTDRADENYRRALSIFREAAGIGPEHRYIASVLHSMARLRLQGGRAAEAETLCREALEMRRKLFGDEDRQTAESRALLDEIHDVADVPSPDDTP